MGVTFQFREVWPYLDQLMWGTWLTIRLSALAMAIGLVIAVVGSLAKVFGPRPLRVLISIYVEAIRNTPFLVQIFLVFFGLPSIGIKLTANGAALTAMVVNVGAYGIEIVRAGIESISRGQIEAGKSLNLRPLQIFRFVILPPALRAIYPALTSQFILLMLGSSVLSAISAEELTAVANDIQSRTFRTVEVYLVVTGIYLVLSLCFSTVFALIERWSFPWIVGPGNRR